MPINEPVRNQNFTGYKAFVAGWGNTQENGKFSKILQQVQVPVLSNADCQAEYESQDRLRYKDQFRSSVICAGYKEGGKDSCQGDSGKCRIQVKRIPKVSSFYLFQISFRWTINVAVI